MEDANHSNYVSLEEFTLLSLKGTPTPPYPANLKTRHVKTKKPLFEDGDRVSWEEVALVLGEEDEDRNLRTRQKVKKMMMSDDPPALMPLKDLMELQPWKTPAPPFSKSYSMNSIKYTKDGDRLLRRSTGTLMRREVEDHLDFEIPYEGLFEFIDKYVVKTIRKLIDRLLGEVCGLAKCDGYCALIYK